MLLLTGIEHQRFIQALSTAQSYKDVAKLLEPEKHAILESEALGILFQALALALTFENGMQYHLERLEFTLDENVEGITALESAIILHLGLHPKEENTPETLSQYSATVNPDSIRNTVSRLRKKLERLTPEEKIDSISTEKSGYNNLYLLKLLSPSNERTREVIEKLLQLITHKTNIIPNISYNPRFMQIIRTLTGEQTAQQHTENISLDLTQFEHKILLTLLLNLNRVVHIDHQQVNAFMRKIKNILSEEELQQYFIMIREGEYAFLSPEHLHELPTELRIPLSASVAFYPHLERIIDISNQQIVAVPYSRLFTFLLKHQDEKLSWQEIYQVYSDTPYSLGQEARLQKPLNEVALAMRKLGFTPTFISHTLDQAGPGVTFSF